jgi:hypothetical protein
MGFKSVKDREAFVQELTAAGFGPEEIAAEISGIEASAPAPAPVPPPAIQPSSQMGGGTADAAVAPPLAPATPAAVQSQAAELTAAREPAGNTLSDQLFTADTAKLLAPAAAYGLYKGAQAIKDRMFSSERPQYPTGVEPTMGAEPETPKSKLPLAAQQQPVFTPKESAVASNITDKYPFSLQEAKTGLGIGDVRITDPTQAELVAKQYSKQLQERAAVPPTAPLAAAPAVPTSVAPPTIAEAPAPAVTAVAEQEVPKAAVPPKKAPKEKTPMPEGWGKGMSWLTTVHGTAGAQAFIDQYNNGKPFASHKEMEDVYKNVTMRPKYSDIPKSVRQERAIIPRASLPNLPLAAVPPPSLSPAPQLGGGAGAMMRGIGDPLQLKQ